MPASRVSTLSLTGGTGSRAWTATASVQDSAAGAALVITTVEVPTGLTPPDAPTAVTLEVRIGSTGAVVRSFPLTLPLTGAGQAVTFYMTNTGLVGGSGRWGTLRMNLRAVKTGGAGSTQYDVDVDGTFNTPPTLFPTVARDKGWVRATTTATQSLSNVSAGGAVPASFAFPDELYLRSVLAHTGYETAVFTATIGAIRSGASSATAGPNVDVSWTDDTTGNGRVNQGFPASATAQTTGLAVANHALSGVAATAFALTAVSPTFDPRVTFTHYMQVNDNTYPASLPNTADAVTPKQRRADESGQLFERVVNARGEGPPLTVALTTTLTHTTGFTVSLAARLVGTVNGQAGWPVTMMTWVEAGPSGLWSKSDTITGPADISSASYRIGATDPDPYLLVALNPNYAPIAGSTGFSPQASHFRPGIDDLFVGYTIRDTARRVTKLLDSAPTAVVNRFNFTTLRLEYLAASPGLAWVPQQAYAFTVSTGTDVLTTSAAHGWANGTAVEVDTTFTGVLPAPLAVGATYYARDVSGSTLKLAATLGGAAIDITTAGTGTFVVVPVAYAHTLAATPDPNVWASVFPTTGTGSAAWTVDDLFVSVTGLLDGYPYTGSDIQLVVGAENRHDVADPAPSLALGDLTDVDVAGALAGDALVFGGATWEDEPMPTAAQVADAVWDEATAASRVAGSYGELVRADLDATVSSRASATALAAVQVDADALQADTATLLARLTSGRAALLDNLADLDAAISSLGSPAQASALAAVQADADALQADTATLLARLTSGRAGLLDNLADLDASVSSLGSPAQAADLAAVQADADALQADTAALLARLTAPRAAALDNLDATVSSRATQASVDAIDTGDPGNPVQADDPRLDNLDVPVSTRQPLTVDGSIE